MSRLLRDYTEITTEVVQLLESVPSTSCIKTLLALHSGKPLECYSQMEDAAGVICGGGRVNDSHKRTAALVFRKTFTENLALAIQDLLT